LNAACKNGTLVTRFSCSRHRLIGSELFNSYRSVNCTKSVAKNSIYQSFSKSAQVTNQAATDRSHTAAPLRVYQGHLGNCHRLQCCCTTCNLRQWTQLKQLIHRKRALRPVPGSQLHKKTLQRHLVSKQQTTRQLFGVTRLLLCFCIGVTCVIATA
jgi:hypothetical protein